MRLHLVLILCLISQPLLAIQYTVEKGDSLRQVLFDHGFSGNQQDIHYEVNKVVTANPDAFRQSNPDRLKPGSQLSLDNYRPEPVITAPEPEPEPVTATIGQLDIKQGKVQIIRQQETLDATRNSPLYSGDRIITQNSTIASMRMRDDSLFELGPDSDLEFTEFNLPNRDNQDTSDDNGNVITTLLKGVARVVTGTIGKHDRSKFVAQTRIASIGIRGTDYTLRYCEGTSCGQLAGTSVAVVDGGIQLGNKAGKVELDKGEFARAESAESAPFEAPMPEGFLDLNIDIADVSTESGWIQSWIDSIWSWFE